jgi:DnaJ-class molecular chaperone
MKDPYETLGVTKNATDTEIKSVYRKLALQYHPDKNKAAGATEKFKEVTQAYEILSNPEKRKTFDQFGTAAFEQGGMGAGGQGPFGGFGGAQGFPGGIRWTWSSGGGGDESSSGGEEFDLNDAFSVFESFFGGGFGGGRRRPRRDIYQVTITLEEAYHGVTKNFVIKGQQHAVKIPAGVDSGNRIRFSDFDIQVEVKKNRRFEREGAHLVTELKISYPDAVLGGEAEVEGIDGPIKFRFQAGTESGRVIRLREQGMPVLNRGVRGDLYVRLLIDVPSKVNSDQKRILEELREAMNKKEKKGWW